MSNSSTPGWWVPTSPIGTGDNSWQLTAASLVALQSVPGLVAIYAGIMQKKWAVNSAFMALYAFAATLICWVLWAYEASFGEYMLPFVGRPNNVLGIDTLLKQSYLPSLGVGQEFPLATMVYFQFVFAAITIVILAGAFLGRMNFAAWMLFVPLWLTLSYTVGAYSVWGGGFLTKLGFLIILEVMSFICRLEQLDLLAATGLDLDLNGTAKTNAPNNILSVLIGAGILWIGWNGFNGGDPYTANADAGVAVLNTNLCTAMSLLTWMVCDMLYFKKPSIMGAVQGMITGLVAITPAAGFVAGWGAILLGLGSGCIPWFTMNVVSKRFFPAFERHFDDTLGITHTHMLAGFIGGFGTGLWATKDGCAAFGATSAGGAIAGNGIQLGYQMAGACFIVGWNLVWTSLILLFIKYVLRIPLRMSDEDLYLGDEAIHGESAYVFGPYESHEEELGQAGGYIQGERMRASDTPETNYETGVVEGSTEPKGKDVSVPEIRS